MSSRIIYFPVLILIHTLHLHMLSFSHISLLKDVYEFRFNIYLNSTNVM